MLAPSRYHRPESTKKSSKTAAKSSDLSENVIVHHRTAALEPIVDLFPYPR